MTAAEPSGRRPRHLTWGRIGVYVPAVLRRLLPAAALDHAPDLGQDHGRDPARQHPGLARRPHLQPWIAAWSEACTGLACEGIQVGFWNSVRILIPSVILSILVGALNGYALCFWRVRGADLLFAILLIGAFIPYQVFLYPLVRLFSTVGIYNSLPGIVVVHIIFGMPIMTLLFRNFYSSLPHELFNAARVDGGGFMTIFWRVMLPMSTPMLIVATILQVTGIWNDFILGLTFAGRANLPMTVQLNNIVNSVQGERAYNVDMAATMLTALVPLVVYFVSGAGSCAASPPAP